MAGVTGVGINGFGRIGMLTAKVAIARKSPQFNVRIANDPGGSIRDFAHRFKYDSTHGVFPGNVEVKGNDILSIEGLGDMKFIGSREVVDWKAEGVELVLESSGKFTAADMARKHIDDGGAKRVLVSAPSKGADATFVFNVNHATFDFVRHFVMSGASCTTNCLAPVAKALNDNFGIERGLMTTIHAATGGQNLIDGPHKDPRRGRSALASIIPATTGAAAAVGLVLPELSGKLTGVAQRVPTLDVSLVDLTVVLQKQTDIEHVHLAMRNASEGMFKGTLGYEPKPLVSIDFKGNPHQSIFDPTQTVMLGADFLKVFAWYDNEWGFTNGYVKLAEYIAARMQGGDRGKVK